MLEGLKSHLALVNHHADQHHQDVHFSYDLALRANEKLGPKFFAPFKILQQVEPVAYKLALPENTKIHPVLHVSRLCQALTPDHCLQLLPLALSATQECVVEPETIYAFWPLCNSLEVLRGPRALPNSMKEI